MNKFLNKPELLAPAGDMEKLKVAINYGADAVYFGGNYGLRAKAKNFQIDEMERAVEYAHKHNVKSYVTVNIIAHNDDFSGLSDYVKDVAKIGADAIIVADPGVFSVAKEAAPNIDIHISTQANNTNLHTVLFWKSLGAKRIVLARELSLTEIKEIKEKLPSDFELEAFVHGAMCISYSGRCLLSNYMSNRDANKGECSQPCRWNYNLVEETRKGEYFPVVEDDRGTYIFNSKDLCMIDHVDDIIDSGIDSLKIEGRMKTPFYVATVINAYRKAIDDCFEDREKYVLNKQNYVNNIKKCSHRHFTTGFYYDKPKESDQNYDTSSYVREYDFIGIVTDYDEQSQIATIEQRNKFCIGDDIEVFRAWDDTFAYKVDNMQNEWGAPIEDAPHPKQIIKIKLPYAVKVNDILQKKCGE